MDIAMEPIGFVHSMYKTPDDLPKEGVADIAATLEVDPRFSEGAADIAAGDRLMVLFYFHLSEKSLLTVPLMGTGPMVGVFSSHSPNRPNSIGVTEVSVVAVDGLHLHIVGADMLDGTPVLDIKPVSTISEH